MKKLSMLILALAMIAVLAVSASASLVIFQNGAADGFTSSGSAGALQRDVKLEEPVNILDYDYMYIRFYCENPDTYINNGQLELTSSGKCDVDETNWDVNTFDIQQGWNELKIDLWAGNGSADYEKINYFRMYYFIDGLNLIAFDYIAFGGEDEDFSSIATDFAETVVLEEAAPEDTVARLAETDSGVAIVSGTMLASPQNIADYDYMFMRVYVEGADNFSGDGQIELSSKGTCDVEELHWMTMNAGLEDGWNEIMLDLYLPDAMDASFNFEHCNFFRMYQFVSGPVKFDLDYIGFGTDEHEFGEDTLPVYLIKPASQDVVEEAPAEEAAAEETVEEVAPVEEAAPAATATVIEATEGFANEGAENLFDKDETTKWCMNVPAPVSVIWQEAEAVSVVGYEIVTANDNESNPGRNPGAWTLYGSTDGANWTVIDAVEADTVLQDVNFTPFAFTASNPGTYNYFKFEVTEIVGGGVMQISGINLVAGEIAEEVVAPAETEAPVVEAPQTFDAAIIAAVAAIVSLAGYAVSKKH